MKKSFMTRVLATGLSLAMAFSLSAATNVSVASAAAKPAMKSSKMTVKVGQKKNYQATAATQKAYKITKVKMSAAGQTKAKVTVNSSKKSIKVEGLAATKGSNVVISFKNNKTKKTTKVTTKVVVKDEKLTLTAEATHVKEIVVTANKAFADASKVKATVKKGTADRAATATVEGSKITLAMDAKLTKGSYTITVEGAEDTAITVPLEVEKDETLTSFWIGDYIVAKSLEETTTGAIKYAALNQYGDKMTTNDVTVTCSFGNVAGQKPKEYATATSEGTIEVTDISPILAIVGTKGSVVIVGDMGVTTSKEISYNSFSKATTAEVFGTYHTNSATVKSISEGDKPEDYELLFTLKDQYGYSVSAKNATTGGHIQVTLNAGLTNVTISGDGKTFKTRTVKGVDYISVGLARVDGAKLAFAGDATLTIVNNLHGLLTNQALTVGKNVEIASMTITADNGVYGDQENELNYEFVDTEGKSVTSYALLSSKDVIDLPARLRFERKDDGSAKLVYDLTGYSVPISNSKSDKNSTTKTLTVKANVPTGGNYLVKTFTFTVYQARVAKSITGIAADTTTSISKKSGKGLEIASTKFVLADQYSNKVTSADNGIFVKNIYNKTATATGTAVLVVTDAAINDVYINTTDNKIVVTPSGIQAGTAAVYLKYNPSNAGSVTVTEGDYDAKFYISVYDTAGVDVTTLEIKSVNDGFSVASADAASASAIIDLVKVVAKVGGTETVIPSDQYVLVKNENNTFTKEEESKGITNKTAKVTVQVTTWDSANTNIETQISKEYTVSTDKAKLYKVSDTVESNAVSSASITLDGAAKTVDASSFVKLFKFKTQFNKDASGGEKEDSVAYEIKFVKLGATGEKDGYTISSSKLNSAKIKFTKAGEYTFKITAITPDGSTKGVSYTITVG